MVAIIALALLPLDILFLGWATQTVYNLLVPELFGLTVFTFAQGCAVGILLSFATAKTDTKNYTGEELFEAVLGKVILTLLYVAMAFGVSLFI